MICFKVRERIQNAIIRGCGEMLSAHKLGNLKGISFLAGRLPWAFSKAIRQGS